MAGPLWAYPGVKEGRITPVFSQAGGSGGYGYSPYVGYYSPYPNYYYGFSSDKVFCLGRDSVPHSLRKLQIGATASVRQSTVVSGADKFWLFMFHMRVPEGLPELAPICLGEEVSFVAGAGGSPPGSRGLIDPADGLSGVILDPASASVFPDGLDGLQQWCQISGATDGDNNGIHRLVCVPEGQRSKVAVIENQKTLLSAPLPDTGAMMQTLNDNGLLGAGVDISLLGARWVGRAYADWGTGYQERVALIEYKGGNIVRGAMSLHLSQYVGPLTVKFEVKLEQVS